ncbi:hypothetical protein BDZ89DRAFT_1137764 [Hymenopellis radicata]|nr:hypothetical protein BDZ89DRAFT_1137764 [Hymenopellis radicata]
MSTLRRQARMEVIPLPPPQLESEEGLGIQRQPAPLQGQGHSTALTRQPTELTQLLARPEHQQIQPGVTPQPLQRQNTSIISLVSPLESRFATPPLQRAALYMELIPPPPSQLGSEEGLGIQRQPAPLQGQGRPAALTRQPTMEFTQLPRDPNTNKSNQVSRHNHSNDKIH